MPDAPETLHGSEDVKNYLSLRKDRPSKILAALAAVLLTASLALFSLGFYQEHKSGPPKWDPLSTFTVPQLVTNGPTIHWDDTVNVTGTKCSKVTVPVRGYSSWEAVAPTTGAVVTTSYGVGVEKAGCTTKSFKHLVPPDVLKLVRAGVTGWEIAGTEVPYRADGTQGVPRTWITQQFTLIPPNPIVPKSIPRKNAVRHKATRP